MSTTTEKVKERLSVVDVVGSYIKLEKAGGNFRARCPFHNEKTPSFFISPSRNTYYCFGCGVKGDIFTFVETFEGTDFSGALRILADRAGVEIVVENKKKKDERERLYDILEEATAFFESHLAKKADALAYLEKRSVTPLTIKEFRIGYAPGDWRSLNEHLLRKGYALKEAIAAGLVKKSDKPGVEAYDVFRGRIMFPIGDSSGRIVAFSGRLFPEDDRSAKYLNSPETELYKKADVLYGLDRAKLSIRKKDFSVLVEGQMDLVMSHQALWRNAVAVSGTALADRGEREAGTNRIPGLEIIRRLSNNVVIAYDNDRAGILAAGRSARLALALGMDVRIAALPEGADPADTIRDDPEVWRAAIRESKPVIDFYLGLLSKAGYRGEKVAKEVQKVVFPYLMAITNQIEREQGIAKVAAFLSVSSTAVAVELAKTIQEEAEKQRPATSAVPATVAAAAPVRKVTSGDKREEAMAILSLSPEVLAAAEIHPDLYKKRLMSALASGDLEIPDPPADVLFRLEGEKDLKRHAAELLVAIERDHLRERRKEIEHEIREGNIEHQLEFMEISKKIEHIVPDMDF